jgi:hypothetical protein
MGERMRFVTRLRDGESMACLCREFGISRKTGYKILDRYEQCGVESLCDRIRRPFRYANQVPRAGRGGDRRSQARETHLGSSQDPRAPAATIAARHQSAGLQHYPRRARPSRFGQPAEWDTNNASLPGKNYNLDLKEITDLVIDTKSARLRIGTIGGRDLGKVILLRKASLREDLK